MNKAIHVCAAEFRRSGRVKGKQPVIEENSVDDPIDADMENSDDDFQPQIHVNEGMLGSSGNFIKQMC